MNGGHSFPAAFRSTCFALLAALRSHPETRVMPFIFLTAKKDRMSRLRALRMGADDYITRPFDEEHVIVPVDGLPGRAAYCRGECAESGR